MGTWSQLLLLLSNATVFLYQLYRKPNDETHYIHTQSYHPPSITKQLLQSIEKHLSQLSSSSKDIFYDTTPYYEQCLANCGYNKKLTYQQQGENYKISGKSRKCNVIWFNTPYSKSLKINIGCFFLDFSTNIFHRATNFAKSLRLSYSYMPNLKTKIDEHNKKTLKNTLPPKAKSCNCLKKKKIAQWEEPASLKMFYTTLK